MDSKASIPAAYVIIIIIIIRLHLIHIMLHLIHKLAYISSTFFVKSAAADTRGCHKEGRRRGARH
jgi:hypothetical protein